MHSKDNHQQNEKTTDWKGKKIFANGMTEGWYQKSHAIQYQKNKWPNQKMGTALE